MSKSNICFNVTFLIKELNLRFANMWTYEIFEINLFNNIYNIYLIQVTYSMYICMCVHTEKNVN